MKTWANALQSPFLVNTMAGQIISKQLTHSKLYVKANNKFWKSQPITSALMTKILDLVNVKVL